MNRERRTTLKKATEYLDLAIDLISEARDDEQRSEEHTSELQSPS